MRNRSYQRRRGELQSLGEIIGAALQATDADPRFYRPRRRVEPTATRQQREVSDQQQLEFNFDPDPPDQPLRDLFPEAYR